MQWIRKIGIALLGGALGGLANSLALWLSGVSGLNAMLDFQMRPELSLPWLMPRMVMSAVWGLLFLIPILKGRPLQKGLVLALAPLALMLFVFFPKMGAGLLGLKLGLGAPFMAALFIAVWGLAAGLVWKVMRGE